MKTNRTFTTLGIFLLFMILIALVLVSVPGLRKHLDFFVKRGLASHDATTKAWSNPTPAIRLDGSVDTLNYSPFIETVDTSFCGWRKVFSNKGRFSIGFPRKGVGMSKENILQNNKYTMVYVCELRSCLPVNSNIGFRADYAFYPDLKNEAATRDLIGYHAAILQDFYNARVIEEKMLDKKGSIAKQYLLFAEKYQQWYTLRIYFHKGILYRLMVTTEAAKANNRFINQFFDSFEMWD